MGGTVLMVAHALYGLPASGMVLIEPILLSPEIYRTRIRVDQHPFAVKAIKRTNFWRDEQEALAYLHSRALFRAWDAEMLELYIRHGMTGGEGGLQLACSPRREASLFMGGLQYDPWPLLAKISCPVCLLEGQKSENGAFIDFDKIHSLIPDCRRSVVDDAGHLIPMERPGEVSRIIEDFFHPLRSRREREAA
jgi:pimeloyl-ACP methyl ester carboxylesterase